MNDRYVYITNIYIYIIIIIKHLFEYIYLNQSIEKIEINFVKNLKQKKIILKIIMFI